MKHHAPLGKQRQWQMASTSSFASAVDLTPSMMAFRRAHRGMTWPRRGSVATSRINPKPSTLTPTQWDTTIKTIDRYLAARTAHGEVKSFDEPSIRTGLPARASYNSVKSTAILANDKQSRTTNAASVSHDMPTLSRALKRERCSFFSHESFPAELEIRSTGRLF